MADIQPFKAIHYNTEIVEDLSKVVAPPYDVINKEQQQELFKRDPNNIIRLDLNPDPDPYPSAAKEMQRMLKERALVQDSDPAIYPYLQTFKTQDGKTVTRRGFVSWIKLEPFEAGVVLPHEHTLSGPKMDRLKLMTATKASFSQIFSIYGDQGKVLEKEYDRAAKSKPFLEADQDGVNNRIYRIVDKGTVKVFQDLLARIPVYIADGHHRYETALEYQRIMKGKNPKHTGKEAYNYIMMYFTNIFDSGLVVYPTHRILHSLGGFDSKKLMDTVKAHFDMTAKSDVDSLASSLLSAGDHAYGMVLPEKKYYLMKLKPGSDVLSIVKENVPAPVKRLDVTLLHDYVLTQTLGISKEAQEKKLNLNYTIDRHEVDEAVQSGKGQLGFILNSTKVEQVKEVADGGAVMPQKSTYFYPKLLSGLLLNALE
ncbi:MAG: DUF1015 domain-containing protein [Bacteroidetes bacterium]|nr:DUF1015 domain-containing protein [Bacteroidota bacterium]MCL5034405.1 DUF1015 domain-containing protein [Bacteroidota bacterium]